MNQFIRVWPFIWPHRRYLYLSFAFAIFVALLWGANISVVYPVVKVLLEKQSLQEWADRTIEENEQKHQKHSEKLAVLEQLLTQSQGEERDEYLERQSRTQAEMSATSRSLLTTRWLKENILVHLPPDKFDTLALILSALLVATIIKSVFIYAQDLMVGRVVELATMQIRTRCFRHVLNLDYQTLTSNGNGSLLSRFTYDVETLANGMSLLGGKVIREPLKAVSCIAFAFCVNWRLTLLSLVFVPLALATFHRFGRLLKKASHKTMESMSRIYKTLEETFDALKVVIAFGGARQHRQKFHKENKSYYQKAMQIVHIDSLSSPVTEILGMLAILVALLPGAYLVLRETKSIWSINLAPAPLEITELITLYALLAGISDPVRKLSSVYAKLKRSAAAADRLFELLDTQPRINDPIHPEYPPAHHRQIDFRHVHFRYYQSEGELRPAALVDVTLSVPFGEVVAIVGSNGSGKSTLVSLLPRLFDADQGEVLIDGTPIQNLRLRDLRRQIGVVTQETILFDETIAANIRYANPDASDEEVEQAAKNAFVTQFTAQLPEGLNTRVGEKGNRLSGGQRQRIALARAILRNPPILILDEATSAIDSQSEWLIHKSLKEFVQNRTTFVITHSLTQSILELVTRIVVMEEGAIRAIGTHAELIKNCDEYQRLYRLQVHQKSA